MKRCKSDDIMIQINEQFDQKSVHKQNSDRSNTQRHKTKKNSYHSVINSIEQNNINNLKLKQLLTRLTLMGYNAYMAEYIIQKEKIKTDLQIEQLVVILIEKIAEIDQEHHRMSACQIKQKIIPKANQILPIQDLPSEHTQQDLNLPECGICVCPMEQKYTIAKCNHVFCLNCVQTYLQERIKESNVMEMPCPQLFCTNIITDDAMKLLITDDQYKKYEEFKARKLLEQDDQVRWCVRAGCPGYVKCGLFQKVVYCECGQGICFTCKGEAHGNLTCEQALDQQYEQVLKALIIQKCPKCRAPIQKKEGCNHMTCFQCKFQFCWICRARYTRMHFDPDNCFGCPDMQFFNVDPQPRQKWKKYGGILFELFASILILPILPIFLMYYAIMAPLKLCKRFNRHKYTQNYDDCDKFMLILLGMCTFPIFLALEICPGSLIYLLYKLRYD